jgi:hypothetical protein
VFVELSTNNEQIDRKCICISHVSHGDVGIESPEARNDSSGPSVALAMESLPA